MCVDAIITLMGNLKETHNVFLGFFFQKPFLCFHGKNPLEITKCVS